MDSYRKKAVVQAARWDGEAKSLSIIVDDLGYRIANDFKDFDSSRKRELTFMLLRVSYRKNVALFHLGKHHGLIEPGDWLVRKDDGHLYALKNDDFDHLYEGTTR